MPRFLCISCGDESERLGWPVPEPCPVCHSVLSCCLDGESPNTAVGDTKPPRGHSLPSSRGYDAAPQAQELLYFIPELAPAEGLRASDSSPQSMPAEGLRASAPTTPPTPPQTAPKPDGRVVEYTPWQEGDKPRPAILSKVHPDGTADLKVFWKFGQFLDLTTIPFAKTPTPGTWSHSAGSSRSTGV